MIRRCDNCKWYSDGVPDQLRKKWSSTNLGTWATGVCNLYFPRGYIGREPPHPTFKASHCFQWEEKDQAEQLALEI